jgi:hypothetical protein
VGAEGAATQAAGADSALTSAAEVEEALGLLEQYADIFSIDGSYGQTNLLKHAIHTADVAPSSAGTDPSTRP